MMPITNISITDKAATEFLRQRSTFKPRRGDVFALVYMFSFTNADGTAVEGFQPGYAAGPWPVDYLSSRWVVAQLPDGTEFHFMPKFKWSAREWYVVDMAGPVFPLFSIGPVATR